MRINPKEFPDHQRHDHQSLCLHRVIGERNARQR